MNQLFDMRPDRPGYRLQRLEIYNWGTFDSSQGQVFRFEPQGRTSLLVGHNGSGKSTLVDAITTLLVDNRSRSYNVAAGAKRTERTPRSYIKGAYDRTADESQASMIRFLRPKGNHFTAISGVFRDEQLDRSFTLTQVLFLKSDGTDDKVYAIADSAHELKDDLKGLLKSDEVKGHLRKAGYQTTKAYVEYLGWLTKRTGMRSKAVDMFNQTVAVKDIQSLNEFIRKHMLEAQNWREKIQRLLTHFSDLSTAHLELVRARRQIELLIPVEELGAKFRGQTGELEQLEQRLDAAASYIPLQFVDLVEPETQRQKKSVKSMEAAIRRYDDELRTHQETIRQICNEIENAGGERLQKLPALIQLEETRKADKQAKLDRFHDQLRICQIKGIVKTETRFAKAKRHLQTAIDNAQNQIDQERSALERVIGRRATVSRELSDEQSELEALQTRPSNLPARFMAIRKQICSHLKLDEAVTPFVAELISVSPDESRWESSVELVLKSFALSLLVPDRYYQRVRDYIDCNRINDENGEGGRFEYIRVGAVDRQSDDRIHPNSLVNKLVFNSGHSLSTWVKSEVIRRFDFRCCETDEEFSRVSGLALKRNHHVSFSPHLHLKDDRSRALDPRCFVLGWENDRKKRRIAEQIDKLKCECTELSEAARSHEAQLNRLREVIRCAGEALEVADFDCIDVGRHETTVAELQREKHELEQSNDTVRVLNDRLSEATQAESRIRLDRDEQVGKKATTEKQIEQFSLKVAQAQSKLERTRREGLFEVHEQQFDSISVSMVRASLTLENFDTRVGDWMAETRGRVAGIRKPLENLRDKLQVAMTKFLREFKEEKDDLDSSIGSLDSFLGLLDQLRREDLPRYEKRFKVRLNDQVTQEVAIFNSELRREQSEIASRIEQLNEALASVEYDRNRGTYMRLDPRPVNDREIEQFRRSLRECLDESLEASEEANETRFHRIRALVDRLGDKERTTWRNKVIDVRNWYDFAALELSRESGDVLSCYDGSSGQSGGEKAKLAFTMLVAALAYQLDIDPTGNTPGRFQFVVVDEMFSKVDDQNAQYALELFRQFGLQLLIVAPLDAKARVTEPFVDRYLHVVKDAETHQSRLYSMSAREYDEVVTQFVDTAGAAKSRRRTAAK